MELHCIRMLNHFHQGCGDPEQERNSSGLRTPRRAILVPSQPQGWLVQGLRKKTGFGGVIKDAACGF